MNDRTVINMHSSFDPETLRSKSRACRREQMSDHADGLWFLSDGYQIPFDTIISGYDGAGQNPFRGLVEWLTQQMTDWTRGHLDELRYSKTELGLYVPRMSEQELRDYMDTTHQLFEPGFMFMCYLFDAIPEVCIRHGVTEPSDWISIAHSSCSLGKALATNGTGLQGLAQMISFSEDDFRDRVSHSAHSLEEMPPSESGKYVRFSPSKFRLADGVIDLVDGADRVKKRYMELFRKVDPAVFREQANCVALQVQYKGAPIFDAFWNIYVSFAERLYPQRRPGPMAQIDAPLSDELLDSAILESVERQLFNAYCAQYKDPIAAKIASMRACGYD